MNKNRRRSSLPVVGLSALLALVLAFSAGGCGQEETQAVPGSDFTADRLPGPGSVYEYYTAAPVTEGSAGIPVSFALESSWDFSSGPTDAIQKASILAPQGLPGADLFPSADLCMQSDLSGNMAYAYYLQDEFTRRLLGTYIVNAEGVGAWEKFEPPKTILRFPMSTDQEALEEEFTYSNSDGSSANVTRMFNVRWIDTITVPAGTFEDTVMMQNYEIYKSESFGTYSTLYYTWYAPDVGQVAFMRGPNNEAQPAFESAMEFRRLKSYQLP